MRQSETIGALAEALAKAQETIGGAIKGSTNPHFRSRYADLASVWDAWQAVGPAQGLAIVQMPGRCEDGRVEMTTTVIHKSGEWMSETLSIPIGRVDAQGYGSAITYARRYALAAACGIAPEDDDGEAAVNRGGDAKAPEKAVPVARTVEDDAKLEAARTWANQQALAIQSMDAESLAEWRRDKRNMKGLTTLEKVDEAAHRTLLAIIEDRQDYLAATGMGFTSDGRAA